MSREVARRYADALLEAAAETGADLRRLAERLDGFAAACAESEELRSALASPATPRAVRARLAGSVAERIAPGDPLLSRFVSLMTARDRADSLVEAAAEFRAALDEHEGIVPAEVTSAAELDGAARGDLRDALAEALGGTPRLDFRVDPALLGGVVVRTGNRIYDASLAGELARFAAAHGEGSA